MTLYELKSRYARLSDEIDTLAAEGVRHEARLLRLMSDLDQVHRELSELRQRTFGVPTLRDAVSGPEPVTPRAVVVPIGVVAAESTMLTPALSMAG
jgi:hypothetical protein